MRLLFLFLVVLLIPACGTPAPVTIPEAGMLKKQPTGMHRENADIPGVGPVRYAVAVPELPEGKTVPLVLVLHYGFDGSVPPPYTGKGMIDAFASGLSGLGAVVIAPDALNDNWKTTKNEQSVVWLTKSAMKSYPIDPKKVVITGFSLGGEGTWYIGSRHQDLFTAAIPVAAPVAGSTDWKIPVYVIHSDKDEIVSFSAAKSHADAIKAKGTTLEFRTATGLSHYKTSTYASHVGEAVRWVEKQWK